MSRDRWNDSLNGVQRTRFALKPDDIVIAVMGITGVGKSTFISHLTDEEVVIGRGLASCTTDVDIFKCSTTRHPEFYLIDTPGFDDSTKSDAEVLRELASWLSATYKSKILLTGIIYLHRIADVRLPGSAVTNLNMFKRLCGDDFQTRVVLATTFWGGPDQTLYCERENELRSKPEWWGSMIKNGSEVFRHDRMKDSARQIVHSLISKRAQGPRSMGLEIQKQLVDEKMTLDQTGAGNYLNSAIAKLNEEWERKLEKVQRDFERALQERDETLQDILEVDRESFETKIKTGRLGMRTLHVDDRELDKWLDEKLRAERDINERENKDKELELTGLRYELRHMEEKHKTEKEKEELQRQIGTVEKRVKLWEKQLERATRCSVM